MIEWIESKVEWFRGLKWYWKILAFVAGAAIWVLFIVAMMFRSEKREGTVVDSVHDDGVRDILEGQKKTDDELADKIEERKNALRKITRAEGFSVSDAVLLESKIREASSFDELDEILRGTK